MKRPIIDNSLTEVRSRQNTSCNWTGTTDFGRLVPFHIEELIPTEKVVTCRPNIELQMLPLASPTFGKIDLYVHYFFVPTRLLWDAANEFFERQGPAKNSIPPYFTYYDISNYYNSLPDGAKRGMFKHWTSMGLPPFFAQSDYRVNHDRNKKDHLTMLKFRAYQKIWWDFYRDPEVLRDESIANYFYTGSGAWSASGANAAANQNMVAPKLRNIKDCWLANLFASNGIDSSINQVLGIVNRYDLEALEISGTAEGSDVTAHIVDGGYPEQRVEGSGTSSIAIRKIEALNRLSERLSLGGKRAIDAMFAAYGVKPDFLKLQMAEYIGGSKETCFIADITSSADTIQLVDSVNYGSPLGQKQGVGMARMQDFSISYTARESGYLVGMLSVMPHVHFNQGIDKSWFRNSLTDWFTKSLERTGQVAVSKKEVAMLSANSLYNYSRNTDDNTFAFTQPYYEYKRGQDILAGDFAKYHAEDPEDQEGQVRKEIEYMQSMEMFIDYPVDRAFSAENLTIKGADFQKVFYYLGGSLWDDVDDHFHLCIDKLVEKDSPADGYAVPTLETTQDPHKAAQSVGQDTVL